MKTWSRLIVTLPVVVAASLLISSCAAPGGSSNPTATVGEVETAVAGTVYAERTKRAVVQTELATANPSPVPPTNTPRPTNTRLVIATDTFTPLPPTETPRISHTPTQEISDFFYEDDFESSQGWPTADGQNFTIEYSGGSYRINVLMNTGDSPVFSARSAIYKDTRAEVDVIRDDGPRENFFGLMCRFTNARNYYRFVVARDGYYNIGKKLDGQYVDLGSGSDNSAFSQGEGVNRIRADCAGNTLILYLNGTKLLEVVDDSFSQGGIGLVVGTRDDKGADIYFDNFAISRP